MFLNRIYFPLWQKCQEQLKGVHRQWPENKTIQFSTRPVEFQPEEYKIPTESHDLRRSTLQLINSTHFYCLEETVKVHFDD